MWHRQQVIYYPVIYLEIETNKKISTQTLEKKNRMIAITKCFLSMKNQYVGRQETQHLKAEMVLCQTP